jgi:hypothetical protein
MLDKPTRAKIIVDHIFTREDQFWRPAPPRTLDSTSLTRVISDDHRWEARWSFEDEQDSDGNAWDLVELFVHRQPALVAVVRGGDVIPRFFIPGQWERMFIDADVFDTVPLLPN